MKVIASSKETFWNRYRQLALFRKLRLRIMTMMLTLVLPVSLTCMVVSVVSTVQGRGLIQTSSQNAFELYMNQVAMHCVYENVDLQTDFPGLLSDELPGLARRVESYQGTLYISRDGRETWRLEPDGSAVSVPEDFEALSQSPYTFFWQSDTVSLRALAVIPYDLSLRSLPVPFWIGMALSLLTVLFCPLLYKRLKLDILDPMTVLDTALEGVKNDRSYRIPPQSGRHADEFLALFDEFNAMAREVQASYEKDTKMLETEMDNLRLQVNPHMLLNSYNMIYALAESKNFSVIRITPCAWWIISGMCCGEVRTWFPSGRNWNSWRTSFTFSASVSPGGSPMCIRRMRTQ